MQSTSLKAPTKAERDRFSYFASIGCICCRLAQQADCGVTEAHHLLSGNKRRGHAYTIPLGQWHHRGEPPQGLTAKQATMIFGPSLARMSRNFREQYGQDDALLAEVDRRIEVLKAQRIQA
jgi:hypothetical protein